MKAKYALLIGLLLVATSVSAITEKSPSCPTCPYHPCPTDFVTLIKKSVTIPVPGKLPIAPFNQVATIQDALDALENYKIKSRVTVTIQLNQNVIDYDTINVAHPDGDKIRIVGNCSGACTILFKPGVNGVYVANGNKLGYLDNLSLIGQLSSQTNGIYAYKGGNIVCGSNMSVQKFSNGIIAERESYVEAPSIKTEYNSNCGIIANQGSSIIAENAVARYNTSNGIDANATSNIYTDNAIASYNGNVGVGVSGNSLVAAQHLQAEYNTYGVYVTTNSSAILCNCSISNNKNYGSSAQFNSTINIQNGTVFNNASVGVAVQYSSIVYAPGAKITGNKPDTGVDPDSHLYYQ